MGLRVTKKTNTNCDVFQSTKENLTTITSDCSRGSISFPSLISGESRTSFQSLQQRVHHAFLIVIDIHVNERLLFSLALKFLPFGFLLGFPRPPNLLFRFTQLAIIFVALLNFHKQMSSSQHNRFEN